MILILQVACFVLLSTLLPLIVFSQEPCLEKKSVQVPQFTFDYKRKGVHGSTNNIQLIRTGSAVIFEVKSAFGIGSGKISLVAGNWPKRVLVRLHLKGLEGFYVSNGKKKLEGFFPSQPHTNLTPSEYVKIHMLDAKGNPLGGKYLPSSLKPDDGKELKGYYEVIIPYSLLTSDIKEVEINWIDFYRR